MYELLFWRYLEEVYLNHHEVYEALVEKEESLVDKRNVLADLQAYQEKTKSSIFETQAALEVLRSELAEENRKLDAKRNEYNLLKSLIDSMEGYPESIKFLHKNITNLY